MRILVLVFLLLIQFSLFYILFRDSQETKLVPSALESTMQETTIIHTEPTNPEPLSVKDEEIRQLLDDYFSPLPKTRPDPPRQKQLYPVKGIYLGQGRNLDAAIELAAWSEVNAFVVDVKESWGLTYQSQVPLAQEIKACQGDLDLPRLIDRCHAEGIHVIARIVCFKDDILPLKKPEMCITDINGELLHYPLEGGQAFANPYDTRVWDYLIDVAKEVVAMGVDEIQFDYVRFPTGSPNSKEKPIYHEIEETIGKDLAINRFLEYARIEIQENLGIPVTADLFSIVMTSEVDGMLIGQNWNTIGLTGINSICPMIYPSHYANSSLGSQGNGVGSYIGRAFFDKPDLEPYAVVQNAMYDGEKASRQKGYAMLRPWLQAFSADWLSPGYYMIYGAQEIRLQIQALYDLGYGEWILWNADYKYPNEAFIQADLAAEEEKKQAVESLVRQSEYEAEAEEKAQEESRRFPIATPKKTK